MRTTLSLLIALAACGPAAPDQPAAEQSAVRPAAPQAVEPVAPASPVATTAPDTRTPEIMLEPITGDEETGLAPGAGCAFITENDILMMARETGGIVKFDGAVRRLSGLPSDYEALVRGGNFTAGDLQLRVTPTAAVKRQEEQTFTYDATLEARTANVSRQYVGEWGCGK